MSDFTPNDPSTPKQQDVEKSRRATWMVVGGVFLALVLFGGGIGLSGAATGGGGCAGEQNQFDLSKNTDPSALRVVGTVSDADGKILAGALLEVEGLDASPITTDEKGRFIMELTPGTYRLIVSGEGHMEQFIPVTVGNLPVAPMKVQLARSERTGDFEAGAGATLELDGLKLTLPANGFVFDDGAAATGKVTWQLTAVTPGDDAGMAIVPALGGIEVQGVINASFFSEGRPVNLADNSHAIFDLPFPEGYDPETDGQLSAFVFDENEFKWTEGEGVEIAEVDGARVLRAKLPHFSWWGVGQERSVDICTIPPGNTVNIRTLSLPEPSLDAHLRNGAYLGSCEDLFAGMNACDAQVTLDACREDIDHDGDGKRGLSDPDCQLAMRYLKNIRKQLVEDRAQRRGNFHAQHNPASERQINFCDNTQGPEAPDCVFTGVEVCDGIDNDCDGTVDQGSAVCGDSFDCLPLNETFICVPF